MPSGWDIKVRGGHQTPAADVAGADDPAAGDTGQVEHLADGDRQSRFGGGGGEVATAATDAITDPSADTIRVEDWLPA